MKTRIETLDEFLAADPNDSFSRYALALELEKENRAGEAISHLQEVIAGDERRHLCLPTASRQRCLRSQAYLNAIEPKGCCGHRRLVVLPRYGSSS